MLSFNIRHIIFIYNLVFRLTSFAQDIRLPLSSRPSAMSEQSESNGWDGEIRTPECQDQNLVPYHLATSHYFGLLHIW